MSIFDEAISGINGAKDEQPKPEPQKPTKQPDESKRLFSAYSGDFEQHFGDRQHDRPDLRDKIREVRASRSSLVDVKREAGESKK